MTKHCPMCNGKHRQLHLFSSIYECKNCGHRRLIKE